MKALFNLTLKAYSKPNMSIFNLSSYKNSFKTFTSFSNNKANFVNKESPILKTTETFQAKPKLFFLSLFYFRSMFTKRNTYLNKNKNYKIRDRKALRRRLIVVGPSFFRHFIHKRTHFHHKKNKKSRANRNKPKYKLLSMAMVKYAKRNLPSYKKKSFKLGKRNV